MIGKKICCFILALAIPVFLFGCGGDGGSSSTGTVSMDMTDAKPWLPLEEHVNQFRITISGVSVHKAGPGDGWLPLPLVDDPYEIDLWQFSDGSSTEFVPHTKLEEGHYTQVRLEVTDAVMTTDTETIILEILPTDVKTDTQFDFEVVGGGAVDLMIDFDLSRSVVARGGGTYGLKPVVHLNETQEAATIQGRISNASFVDSNPAIIIVNWDKDENGEVSTGDEEYTRVVVKRGSSDPTEFTEFSIFWLVPEKYYEVLVDLDDAFDTSVESSFEYTERVPVPPDELEAGDIVQLNDGDEIP